MKRFNLGDKVLVKKYYNRNNRKPFENSSSHERYTLVELDEVGVYCGRRNIWTKGYSEYIGYEEGFTFVPIKNETVHLVAISHKQLVYVPSKCLELLENKEELK